MPSIDELVIRLKADIKDLQAGLNKAKSEVAAFGSGAAAGITSTMKSVQEQMHHTGMAFMKVGMDAQMAGMNMTMAVAPFVAALGLAAKGAGDFATDLNKLKVVAGGTSEEMVLAKTTISDLSKTYGVSVGDMTKVATDFAAIGFSMKDSLELTKQAALLATSGLGTTEQATTLLTQAVSQYNLPVSEAARLTDIFSYIANATSANVAGLSTSFGYVGTTAKQVGMSINETAAILGIIQNSLQDASMSGTGFREILNSLINPTTEAAEMLQQYNIVIRDASGTILPMATIIDNVKASVTNLNAAERDLALSTIFGVRGMSAMNALMTTGSEKIRELTKGTEQQGYAAGVAKDMLGGFGAQVSQLRQQIEEVAREVGETLLPVLQEMMTQLKDALPAIKEMAQSFATALIPALRYVFEIGMKLVAWFNGLSPEMKKLIATVTALGVVFAAVVGPILLFGGMIAGSIGNLLMLGSALLGAKIKLIEFIAVHGGLSGIASSIAASFMGAIAIIKAGIASLTAFMAANPILLVIMGIVAAVIALKYAWDHNLGGIQEKTRAVVEWVSAKLQWLKEKLEMIPTPLLLLLGPIGAVLAAFKHWDEIKGYVGGVVDSIKNFLGITDEAETRTEMLAEKQERLADAEKELAHAEKNYQDAQAKLKDSTEELAAAEAELEEKRNNLTSATSELERAEKSVADAKQKVLDLTRDIGDAEDDLADKRLGVRSATLDLKDAQKEYTEALQKHGASSDEVERASIRLERAKLRIKGANEEVIDAEKKLSETQTSAKERSDAVIKAEEMKATALDKVKKAQIDLKTETDKQAPIIQKLSAQVEIDTSNLKVAELKKVSVEAGVTALKLDTSILEKAQKEVSAMGLKMPEISFEDMKKSMSTGWEAAKKDMLKAYEGLRSGAIDRFNDIIGSVRGFASDHKRELNIIGGAVLTVATGGMWPLWKNNVSGIRTATTEAWEDIKVKTSELAEWLAAKWEEIKTAASEAYEALRNTVNEKWEAIKTTVSDAINGIVNTLTPYYEQLKNIGNTLFTKLKEGLELAYNAYVKPYIDIITGAITTALDFGAKAYNWGRNLLSSFVNGIKSVWSSLTGALDDWANKIERVIGIYSPAKEGPLSHLMEWGPNLVTTFAAGIKGNVGKINEALALLQPEPIEGKISIDVEAEPVPKLDIPDKAPTTIEPVLGEIPAIPEISSRAIIKPTIGDVPKLSAISKHAVITPVLGEMPDMGTKLKAEVELIRDELDKFMEESLTKTVDIAFAIQELPKITVPSLSTLLYLKPVIPQIPAMAAPGVSDQNTGRTSEIHNHTHTWSIRIEKIENKADADYLLGEIERKIVKRTAAGVL